MTVQGIYDVPIAVVMYLNSNFLGCRAAYIDSEISLVSCIFSGVGIEKPFDTRHPSLVIQINIITLN
jgi:hypothetical protein